MNGGCQTEPTGGTLCFLGKWALNKDIIVRSMLFFTHTIQHHEIIFF